MGKLPLPQYVRIHRVKSTDGNSPCAGDDIGKNRGQRSGRFPDPDWSGAARGNYLTPLAGTVGLRILLSPIQSVSRCGQFLIVASCERWPRLKPCPPLVKT